MAICINKHLKAMDTEQQKKEDFNHYGVKVGS